MDAATVALSHEYQAMRYHLQQQRHDLLAWQELPPAPVFAERMLQIAWNEQCFDKDLYLTDGRRLLVQYPGGWNLAGGPDFRDARLSFDGIPVVGAVEVHRDSRDWVRHGHDHDPAYDQVVLHVVWQAPAAVTSGPPPLPHLPCLAIRDHVHQTWQPMIEEVEREGYPYGRQVPSGECAVRWALAADGRVRRLLQAAGLARFGQKSTELQARAAAVGFEQALYEQLMRAMGYQANRAPFEQLARSVTLAELHELGTAARRRARLFGAAGLLPDPTTTAVVPAMRTELDRLWREWWRLGCTPLPVQWRRDGSRPANSPERRLLAATLLLEACQLQPGAAVLARMRALNSAVQARRHLRQLLTLSADDAAARFCTFRRSLAKPARLLGSSRADDIIVNVLLPFLQAWGHAGQAAELVELSRATYLQMPLLQANRPLQECVQRFLVPPSRGHQLVRRACEQQGLLAISHDFCRSLQYNCTNCPFVLGFAVADHSLML